MKTPLRTDPILITAVAQHGCGYDYLAKAQVNTDTGLRKMRATSTCSRETAARNLALRHFFGGNTQAFVGEQECAAIKLTPIGTHQFRAELAQ